jgi:excisionase family DNA binding protein
MKNYITVSEVARDLGLSSQTIYKWFQSGQFVPMFKLGGSYRIEAEAYIEWKENQLGRLNGKKVG